MTVELFRTEPYRAEFRARIVGLPPQAVVLDQTCFAPMATDIPSGDLGSLEHFEVIGSTVGRGRSVARRL